MSEPVAASKRAPLELKLGMVLGDWLYSEFRGMLFKEAGGAMIIGMLAPTSAPTHT